MKLSITLASASLGVPYTAVIPALATQDGRWLSFSEIASSIFGRRYTLPLQCVIVLAGCLSGFGSDSIERAGGTPRCAARSPAYRGREETVT